MCQQTEQQKKNKESQHSKNGFGGNDYLNDISVCSFVQNNKKERKENQRLFRLT